ncbi:hypothetical protein GF380_03095 [Candidatus Uhrbacteria bacterium]|nr:hypothetical protein [Candidatus Uhrbacteria bacterium]
MWKDYQERIDSSSPTSSKHLLMELTALILLQDQLNVARDSIRVFERLSIDPEVLKSLNSRESASVFRATVRLTH